MWPTVSRLDDVHGDRNLVCSCEPIEVLPGPRLQAPGSWLRLRPMSPGPGWPRTPHSTPGLTPQAVAAGRPSPTLGARRRLPRPLPCSRCVWSGPDHPVASCISCLCPAPCCTHRTLCSAPMCRPHVVPGLSPEERVTKSSAACPLAASCSHPPWRAASYRLRTGLEAAEMTTHRCKWWARYWRGLCRRRSTVEWPRCHVGRPSHVRLLPGHWQAQTA